MLKLLVLLMVSNVPCILSMDNPENKYDDTTIKSYLAKLGHACKNARANRCGIRTHYSQDESVSFDLAHLNEPDPESGATPLMHALYDLETSDPAMIAYLLRQKADASAVDRQNFSVIMHALQNACFGVIPLLIKHGAKLPKKNEMHCADGSPLLNGMVQCLAREINVLEFYNADDNKKNQLVHDCARCAELFIREGYPFDNSNWFKETPLSLSAEFGFVPLVNLFLKHGADPEKAKAIKDSRFTCSVSCRSTCEKLIEEALVQRGTTKKFFFNLP